MVHVRQCVASYCSFFMTICHFIPDVDECSKADMCLGGVCANTEGSFTCTRCKDGYRVSQDRQRCEGESSQSLPQLEHSPTPSVKMYNCLCYCDLGVSYLYIVCLPIVINVCAGLVSPPDIDECRSGSVCANGICLNSEGSYSCITCPSGYSVSLDGELCEGLSILPETTSNGLSRRSCTLLTSLSLFVTDWNRY